MCTYSDKKGSEMCGGRCLGWFRIRQCVELGVVETLRERFQSAVVRQADSVVVIIDRI